MSLADLARRASQGLAPDETRALSEMERSAMHNETAQLLAATQGTSMPKSAQIPPTPPTPPKPPEPLGQTAQEDDLGNVPMGAPPPPAPPPGGPAAQGAPPPPAPGAAPMVPPAAAPPAQTSIDQFVNEDATPDPAMSPEEMGMKPTAARAMYAEAYAHLRLRPTADRHVEVFDPLTKKALLLVRLNPATRKNAALLRKAGQCILMNLAYQGLTATAKLWRGALYRSADQGGVVDFGDNTLKDKPDFGEDGTSNARGDSVLKNEEYGAAGVKKTTKEDGLAATEPHPSRSSPGLGGKDAGRRSAGEAPSGGVQNSGDTNMSPQPDIESSSSLDVTKDMDNVSTEKPEKPRSNVLEDAVTTFANESLTSKGKSAQAAPPPAPAPAPGGAEAPCGMCGKSPCACPPDTKAASLAEIDQRYRTFYANKCAQDTRRGVELFCKRFVRATRLAARRMAANDEQNDLKIAMANALMNPAALSAREEYTGMDDRTAVFVIERGLDKDATLAFVDRLITRAAAMMRTSEEVLAQMEEDLDQKQPVMPAQMTPPDPMAAMPPMEGQMGDPAAPPPPDAPMPPMEGQMDPGAMPPPGGPMPAVDGQMGPPPDPMGAPPPGGEMPPMEGQADPGAMDPGAPMPPPPPEGPDARAAALRRQAAAGNPVFAPPSSVPESPNAQGRRSSIRAALSGTRVVETRSMLTGRGGR